jgi:hypothetical protein
MTRKLKPVLLTMGVFGAVFFTFCVLLYINAYFFTPMPDNDADLAAWGMRFVLIPWLSFLYTALIFMVFVKLNSFLKGKSGNESE